MSYSSKYLDHFTNPRGVGEIEAYNAISEVEHSGSGCFDKVKLTLKISDGIVTDAKFRARACSGTIAACSALTESIINRNVEELKSYTTDDLIEYLDGIPEKKRHSVDLAIAALREALPQ